ncbi:Transcriptional regulator TetR family [Patulibacter medicamentivorans]|uniref:Transcriptional regulator TetR family n=1 Tax=Patulibacter medicamentivorans TaxID=1097667 RepID=H0E6G0_9ACTN|nr:TetR family transcriptional regulator [Patulibacter medicamentivorans]EHN10749.1 Transcriptional regulator TetR family [Patulibacter medicamentivorans]
MSDEPDGRRRRGLERRRQLLDAALVVLERDGAGGLTHRRIAAEAGVPLASASYHFDGIDDLIVSTMLHANEQLRVAADAAAEGGQLDVDVLAGMLVDDLVAHRDLIVAEYELYLLAARRPALRAAATAWLETIVAPLIPDADPVQRQLVFAVADGLCLQTLMSDEPPRVDEFAAVLRRALAATAG